MRDWTGQEPGDGYGAMRQEAGTLLDDPETIGED